MVASGLCLHQRVILFPVKVVHKNTKGRICCFDLGMMLNFEFVGDIWTRSQCTNFVLLRLLRKLIFAGYLLFLEKAPELQLSPQPALTIMDASPVSENGDDPRECCSRHFDGTFMKQVSVKAMRTTQGRETVPGCVKLIGHIGRKHRCAVTNVKILRHCPQVPGYVTSLRSRARCKSLG